MKEKAKTAVDIGTIKVACRTTGTGTADTLLHVGSCIGWTQGGDNRQCPVDNAETGTAYRLGTVPGTSSKCNCEGFTIPVVVQRTAKLEVVKACSPTTDAGTFDLLIDGSNQYGDNKPCGGTTGAQTVTAGTSANPGAYHKFAEGDFTVANYTSTYSCVNRVGGASRKSGTGVGPDSINFQPNDDIVCTFTNTRNTGKLELKKALSPTTDAGTFNLFITAGASDTLDSALGVGNGGTTGSGGTTLNIGTYHLSESAAEGTTKSDYTESAPVCVNRGDESSVTVTNGDVVLAKNADVVCTITNTRNTGKLELKKSLSPTTDPGTFNLWIKAGSSTGTVVDSAKGIGDAGTTGSGGTTLNTGTYNVSETPAGATLGTDYTTTGPSCVNRADDTPVTVTSGSLSLVKDADVVCTITNTRQTGKLELVKTLSPSTDPGKFNLYIKAGSSTGTTVASATDVGNGGTTESGGTTLPTGTYNLSEAAGTGTSLADYTSTGPACAIRGPGGAVVSVTDNNVVVGNGQDIICSFSNTRDNGKLELRKVLSPTTDLGVFDLFIKTDNSSGTTVASATDVGNGGTTGSGGASLAPGTYYLGESGGTNTTAGNYTTTGPVCVNRGDESSVTVTSNTVVLASNADVVCTYTNTRNTAKLELKKVVSPSADPGKFNLYITAGTDTLDSALDVGPQGSTGAGGTTLNTGTYHLSEAAGSGTSLADYNATAPSCKTRLNNPVSVTDGDVTLAKDADVVCTITNTRKTGRIELKKALSPTTDGGKFNLYIKAGSSSGTTKVSVPDVGDGGTTNSIGTILSTGSYYLGESAGTGTTLDDYTASAPVCVNRDDNSSVTVTSNVVSLVENADLVCTITNTRKTGKLELKKALSPTTDPGLFNLFIKAGSSSGSTVASASNVGNGGTTQSGGTELQPGTYNLSETAGTGTSLADYSASAPVCVNRGDNSSVSVTSGNVTLASSADVVCTITNTQLGRGAIAPTQTSCQEFVAGKYNPLTAIDAAVKGTSNTISSVSPGVFFYYAAVTLDAGATVGFTQTVSKTGAPLYLVQNGQVFLYSVSGGLCTKVATLTETNAFGGYQGTLPDNLPGGNYILGVKFETSAAKGPYATYLSWLNNFALVGGGSPAHVETRRK